MVATATDPNGNTSEFSACHSIVCHSETMSSQPPVTTEVTWETCDTLTLGPDVAVGAMGDLTLRAGAIVLENGVSVLTDGAMTVDLHPAP